jgi:hypothetical protein
VDASVHHIDLADATRSLGGEVSSGQVLCPGPNHSMKDRSLSVRFDPEAPGGFVVNSFAGDDALACRDYVRERLGLEPFRPGADRKDGERRSFASLPPAELARKQSEREAQTARELISKVADAEFTYFSASPIEGTLAETYLASRGLAAGADLRFSRFAPFSYGGRTGPGMVAAIRDGHGVLIGCQVTHLTPEGRKVRRTTFGSIQGGAVRLVEPADGVLAVAEGVETALAFTALCGLPCQATLGTSGLAEFQPPPGLTRLYVAADNDANGKGLEAARKLAERASAWCEVVLRWPPEVGDDFADVLANQKPRAA